jgi:hypothetical protein
VEISEAPGAQRGRLGRVGCGSNGPEILPDLKSGLPTLPRTWRPYKPGPIIGNSYPSEWSLQSYKLTFCCFAIHRTRRWRRDPRWRCPSGWYTDPTDQASHAETPIRTTSSPKVARCLFVAAYNGPNWSSSTAPFCRRPHKDPTWDLTLNWVTLSSRAETNREWGFVIPHNRVCPTANTTRLSLIAAARR